MHTPGLARRVAAGRCGQAHSSMIPQAVPCEGVGNNSCSSIVLSARDAFAASTREAYHASHNGDSFLDSKVFALLPIPLFSPFLGAAVKLIDRDRRVAGHIVGPRHLSQRRAAPSMRLHNLCCSRAVSMSSAALRGA